MRVSGVSSESHSTELLKELDADADAQQLHLVRGSASSIVNVGISYQVTKERYTVPQETNIAHLEKKENDLQKCLGGGYVSFMEGISLCADFDSCIFKKKKYCSEPLVI